MAYASTMRCHFSLLTCSFLPGQEQPDITDVLQLWPHLLIRRTFESSHLMMQLPQRLIQRLLPHRPLMQPLMLGLLLLRCPACMLLRLLELAVRIELGVLSSPEVD